MGEILTLDGDSASHGRIGLISTVCEATFKPGIR
jgi:hypothetical protein